MSCLENEWVSSVTFDLGIQVLMFLVFVVIALVFGRSLNERYHEMNHASHSHEPSKLSRTISSSSVGPNQRYLGGFRKQEFVDIAYVCGFIAGLLIAFVLSLLHFTPQFSDSLVSEKGESSEPDYSSLLPFCVIERTTIAVLANVLGWLQFRLIYSRLFSIFASSPRLRFTKRFEWMMKHIIIDGLIGLFVVLYVIITPMNICVGKWSVVEYPSNHRLFFNCSNKAKPEFVLLLVLNRAYAIFLNVLSLILFLKKFWQMIDLYKRRSSVITSVAEDRNLSNLVTVMSKLTTLGLAVISSSLFITLIGSILFAFGIPIEYLGNMDSVVNLMCLILLFSWMDPSYQLLCTKMCPCIHEWVTSHITDDHSILHDQISSNNINVISVSD